MSTRGQEIFVLEDEAPVRTVLVEALTDEGYRVTGFGDGHAALAALTEHQPHLILLDMRMPRLDGFQFLERLRRIPLCKSVPVIIVSGLGDELLQAIDANAAQKLGVAGIFAKPFDIPTLLRYVGGIMSRDASVRGSRPPSR